MSYRDNYRLIDFSRDVVIERKPRLEPKRSDLPCPLIMGDVMEPVQSMHDGKIYDSKSALRRTYRSAGLIEVGNDPARLKPRQKNSVDAATINTTVEIAAARVERGERNLFPGK